MGIVNNANVLVNEIRENYAVISTSAFLDTPHWGLSGSNTTSPTASASGDGGIDLDLGNSSASGTHITHRKKLVPFSAGATGKSLIRSKWEVTFLQNNTRIGLGWTSSDAFPHMMIYVERDSSGSIKCGFAEVDGNENNGMGAWNGTDGTFGRTHPDDTRVAVSSVDVSGRLLIEFIVTIVTDLTTVSHQYIIKINGTPVKISDHIVDSDSEIYDGIAHFIGSDEASGDDITLYSLIATKT